ncbi:hypothetical protein RGF97_27975 [Streptomyces roseicoloratus]|uniref:Uncharacterized protein n=1 Tax=Streptomyces roseicoloratus TaxID=2508722 RepID=A0ABY9S0D8_9ACTN|nr:hypothetical protein [Streptomyces roseicoloratus]WMX47876.1 hypothetical protein RGF97_27975 [Streptomyces roseicoloratus]
MTVSGGKPAPRRTVASPPAWVAVGTPARAGSPATTGLAMPAGVVLARLPYAPPARGRIRA